MMVATVDHHHVLASMLDCQAGKDVYCEKPLSLYQYRARGFRFATVSHAFHAERNASSLDHRLELVSSPVVAQDRLGLPTAVVAVRTTSAFPFLGGGLICRNN